MRQTVSDRQKDGKERQRGLFFVSLKGDSRGQSLWGSEVSLHWVIIHPFTTAGPPKVTEGSNLQLLVTEMLILQHGHQQEQKPPGNFNTHCCFPLMMFQDAQVLGKKNIKKPDNLSKLGKDALTKL